MTAEGIPYEWPSGHRLAGRPRPSRRLVVAGVIRRGEMDPPGTRAVAITADWGHPRGPIAGKVIWDVEADADAPMDRTLRGEATAELFRQMAALLEEEGE